MRPGAVIRRAAVEQDEVLDRIDGLLAGLEQATAALERVIAAETVPVRRYPDRPLIHGLARAHR